MAHPAIENILSRKTIRQFEQTTVRPEIIDDLLAAGMAAPTAFDARPWHFVTISDPAMMAELGRAMPGCEMCEQTAQGILVCGDSSQDKLPDIWTQDCAACVQNIQLATHAHGLGTVWLAIYLVEERVQAVRDLLHIPGHIIPFALLPIGIPAEPGSSAERFLPGRIHQGRW